MHRIDIKAVVIAFFAELCVDMLVVHILIMFFGRALLVPDMPEAEFKAAVETIAATGDYQLVAFACGMATTILGGYLAARLAKDFPYYNGLAIGVVGIVFVLAFSDGPLWITIVGVLLTIPGALYGAHLAKKRRPAPTDEQP